MALPGPLKYCRRNPTGVLPLFGCTAATVALLLIIGTLGGSVGEAKSQLRRHHWTFASVELHDAGLAASVQRRLAEEEAVGLLVPARQIALAARLPLGWDVAQVYLIPEEEPGLRALGVGDCPPLEPGQVLLHRGLLRAAGLGPGDRLPQGATGFPPLTVAGELPGSLKIGVGRLPAGATPDSLLVFPRSGNLDALERVLLELEADHRGGLTVATRDRVRRELAADNRFLDAIANILSWLVFLVLVIIATAAAGVATRARSADFAVLAVLGFSVRAVLRMLLLEAVLVAGAGLAAGAVAGLAGLLAFRPLLHRSGLDPFIPAGLVGKAIALPLILALVTGATSLAVLRRVDPVSVIERAVNVTGR